MPLQPVQPVSTKAACCSVFSRHAALCPCSATLNWKTGSAGNTAASLAECGCLFLSHSALFFTDSGNDSGESSGFPLASFSTSTDQGQLPHWSVLNCGGFSKRERTPPFSCFTKVKYFVKGAHSDFLWDTPQGNHSKHSKLLSSNLCANMCSRNGAMLL